MLKRVNKNLSRLQKKQTDCLYRDYGLIYKILNGFPGDSAWRDKVSVSISCLSLREESENSFDIYSNWLKFIQEK